MVIDTHQLPESSLSLYFERDNPCNTTIVDQDRNTFYTVATDFANPDKPVTRVHDGIGKLVAEWIWRDARSDILTIPGRPQTPASAWLKKSIIPFWEYVSSLFLSPAFFFPPGLKSISFVAKRREVSRRCWYRVRLEGQQTRSGITGAVVSSSSPSKRLNVCVLPTVALRPTIQDAARGPFYPLV